MTRTAGWQKLHDLLRMALQNEIAQKIFNTKTKSETKNLKTDPKHPRKISSPVQLPKSFSLAIFHSFCTRNFKRNFRLSFHNENLQAWPR